MSDFVGLGLVRNGDFGAVLVRQSISRVSKFIAGTPSECIDFEERRNRRIVLQPADAPSKNERRFIRS